MPLHNPTYNHAHEAQLRAIPIEGSYVYGSPDAGVTYEQAAGVKYEPIPSTAAQRGGSPAAAAMYAVPVSSSASAPGPFTLAPGRSGTVVLMRDGAGGVAEAIYGGNAFSPGPSTGSAQSDSTNVYDMQVPGMRSNGINRCGPNKPTVYAIPFDGEQSDNATYAIASNNSGLYSEDVEA
jgi:hypothetical protein